MNEFTIKTLQFVLADDDDNDDDAYGLDFIFDGEDEDSSGVICMDDGNDFWIPTIVLSFLCRGNDIIMYAAFKSKVQSPESKGEVAFG